MPRIAAAERGRHGARGNRWSERGADGERFPLHVNVLIFIAIVIKRPGSLCPARGRDFGSAWRWRRLSCRVMGAPMGVLFPRALKNGYFWMLYWITADFWETALGFRLNLSSFSRDLLQRERHRSTAPAQALWIWLFSSTPSGFWPQGVTGLPWVLVVPTTGPQAHSQTGAGVRDHQPGDSGDTAPPSMARGKIHPGLSQCPAAPSFSRKKKPRLSESCSARCSPRWAADLGCFSLF